MISIRRLQVGEGELYKQVRLAALREAPYAFSTTVASALQRSPESWSEQADASAQGTDRATFIAFSEEKPVGMAAFYRGPESKDTGEVLQVWVSPEYRGKGVAKALMDAIIVWARENGFHRVLAGVMQGNQRALNFYLKYGFRPLQDGSGMWVENMYIMEIV